MKVNVAVEVVLLYRPVLASNVRKILNVAAKHFVMVSRLDAHVHQANKMELSAMATLRYGLLFSIS